MQKISHVTLLVKDQNDALDFYQNKLGFKVHTDAKLGPMRWLTLCTVDQPDFELSLMQAGPKDQDLVGRQGGSYPLLALETKDCHESFKRLKSLGIKFDGEPQQESWGTGVTFRDLYGNLIYLHQSH